MAISVQGSTASVANATEETDPDGAGQTPGGAVGDPPVDHPPVDRPPVDDPLFDDPLLDDPLLDDPPFDTVGDEPLIGFPVRSRPRAADGRLRRRTRTWNARAFRRTSKGPSA